ncbi:hypothetical protein P872_12930 [Rhodonellum psychrophilum GCM71 = DSM 17998]|uniref:NdvB n=2 Tax=Rhodonellum TaxID=336827 RepID=U5BSX2_9BACT|nr:MULTISPECIES: glycoside hydrolase family 94 protein [Rhodonellum]ERM80629.1 hypothetical protein P872_12930 [Rhodonellum psychrophilum GCM71 = DSM 17998]SDZ16989.1 Cellobiose phosphorylase [Rhodonellum ikkaensis]
MMKVTTSSVFDILSHWRVYFQGGNAAMIAETKEPFRSELFSMDQIYAHGKVLAKSHKLQVEKPADKLLKRLDENETTLVEARNLLVESIRLGKTITPAAEWLLDNFYLIEEQVVIARDHLPKGYSETLPSLGNGLSSGLPRVYDIVLEIISHSDGRVDVKSLSNFISAYQTVSLLTLGELWAIPIMLRLAVIENLRRIANKIALDMVDHNFADYWADRMIATVKESPGNLVLDLADMARSNPVLVSPFVAGMVRKLQGKGPALALPLTWMEQKLVEMGYSSNELVGKENQKQAANQVSVRNSIGTLRFLGANDWREFVETLSSVEEILRQDVSGTYPFMDFATRDRYRHVVEAIAKYSPFSETEVAQKAVDLAHENAISQGIEARMSHVGYFLVDKGLEQTEKICERRYTFTQKFKRFSGKIPMFLYFFSIAALTGIASYGMLHLVNRYSNFEWPILAVLALIAVSGAAQLAVSLVNWIATISVNPKMLPRMDFSRGIPTEFRSLVVIPTMLSSKAYIEELVEALEIRFLANKEKNVHYGLLTDFMDAGSELMPEDDGFLELVSEKIEVLNQKYQNEEDIFFLFHRPRTWNEREGKWMGYERKRGKLSALNALLRGKDKNEFSLISGNQRILSRVKYVITLDSDTQLPRETVWKFIATMAHPLNHPVFDPKRQIVTEGYGILQPRVAAAISKSAVSLYSRMQGDVTGIDPYTRVSSDVYQDLFGEGSFIGKGIYDVDVFEQGLNGVFPENRILSHDLLEGCYVRSGLLSDVLLYEENPSQYHADIKRYHRWTRGDWQIAAWIFPFVKDADGQWKSNPLSSLSKWKLFDNLRRSLVPLCLLLVLLMGWTILPFSWFWTAAVTLIVLLPLMMAAGWQLLHKPIELNSTAHLSEVGGVVRDFLIRFVFGLAVLPYEAFVFADAVFRTIWRIFISGKKLLEWTPSANTARKTENKLLQIYGKMIFPPLLSLVLIGILVYNSQFISLLVASPILLLWLMAPALAWRLGKPKSEKNVRLPEDELFFLHKTARKTWSFFQQFVAEPDNFLPPDNFQEEPVAKIAHRTSPTNMGLALLANLSAYDFGYIGSGELVKRSRQTMSSMLELERYKGHFYNWYDTVSLTTLQPKYISTVDSGNLIGHLLTFRQGLLALPEDPIVGKRVIEGLRTTAGIVMDFSVGKQNEISAKIMGMLETALATETLSLRKLKNLLDDLVSFIEQGETQNPGIETEYQRWIKRLLTQIKNTREDWLLLAPWLELTPVPEQFGLLAPIIDNPTLHAIQTASETYSQILDEYAMAQNSQEQKEWLAQVREALAQGGIMASKRNLLITQLAEYCEQLSEVDYDFLFDKSTSLLSIGYNVEERKKDSGNYDLLASEARLGIFVAIAQGKLPQESWFALGRLLTDSGGGPILLSWSGSMFEYLMPQLVMPVYENTLLFQTNKATVKRQIEYGAQRGVPWGISESGYNQVDASLNYQYHAFGVPGIGLKRGLEEDLVIAPYATMMALMVSPKKAYQNLELLYKEGFEGEFGFYEAIDYTVSRLPRGEKNAIVRSYMVHHQGMGLLSLAYLLLDQPMQQRFVSELRFQATILLLQERIPRTTLFFAHTADLMDASVTDDGVKARIIQTPNTQMPEVQLLSNGNYQVMVTNSGGGYSRWKDIVVTRWREDTTQDNRGIFCYIKDISSGVFWSNTYQPTMHPAKVYQAVFSQGHAEFYRQDYGVETKTEIVISPEDDTEMRRIRITNKTNFTKILEVTSYAEIVLASQASDEAHPAFSNLFVQTEILPEDKAVICTRRPRSEGEIPPWMFHLMETHGAELEEVSYETDRMEFIGRGNTLAHPQALKVNRLSGKQGSVLDPIVSIRLKISIKPQQTGTVDLIYGISDTRESCEALMHKYRDRHLKKRAFELSWTHNQVLLRQINATESDAHLYDRLAASLIYPHPSLRADPSVILANSRGQSGLWSHSVSGDIPIVLLHIQNPENMELVKQMVQAHGYWRLKGLAVDLVIWNEDHGAYRKVLQEQILGLITMESFRHETNNKPGNIFVKSADQLSPEDRVLFESVARIIIHDSNGTLSEQVNREIVPKALPPLLEAASMPEFGDLTPMVLPRDLLFFNGTGGFSPDGKSYKILTDKVKTTPAPWVNVIANPGFGSVISQNGSAYTWSINAHEYRITPWHNDPVSDTGGEAFYLRDEKTGHFWSPSPFPRAGKTPYITTHGFGYSTFEHSEMGLHSEMCVFVDKDLPVKFIVLKIKNQSGTHRKISAVGFMEMILGDLRSKTNMHVFSEWDQPNGALLFRNRYNTAFAEKICFFKVEGAERCFTGDRGEFIGRNRNLEDPQALHRTKLSGSLGAGLDPCAALQVKFDLLEGEEKEIIFQLGTGNNPAEVEALLQKFADQESVKTSLQAVKEYWEEMVSTVQVTTPDPALDILTNGWLTYQTIACRIFARSGFYQSGGAFGFRDQLQDVLALLHSKPMLAREQILLSASRQFVEGDVQHWWHPPEGRGVRTTCSDDLLWLPYVLSRYITDTGDSQILDEQVGFLEGRLLAEGEDSIYDLPSTSNLKASLYEHGVRAINQSLRFGSHGLPLIGSGDWNDGMDQVGHKGQGESVWLAFFLYDVLSRYEAIASGYGDSLFADTCRTTAKTLKAKIEASGWDGEWYLRAFFDDGSPLGSKQNVACRIDAISQSWAVLSGAGDSQRILTAMDSLEKHLVRKDLQLIQLLDPPFDKEGPNPGYIKGYVPGVRENGGQYSHAAIWTLMAFAALGQREKVYELFSMVQPIGHASDADKVKVYKVEPYVMAADVYANESHEGRGGWTWYTGSSGWMYQFITGSLIGMKIQGNVLSFNPCFPLSWPSVSVIYRKGSSTYRITVFQTAAETESWWKMDDQKGLGASIVLEDDGKEHIIEMQVPI